MELAAGIREAFAADGITAVEGGASTAVRRDGYQVVVTADREFPPSSCW